MKNEYRCMSCDKVKGRTNKTKRYWDDSKVQDCFICKACAREMDKWGFQFLKTFKLHKKLAKAFAELEICEED